MGYHEAPAVRVSGRFKGPQTAKAVRGFTFQCLLDGEQGAIVLRMESVRIPSRRRQLFNVVPQQSQACCPTAVASGSSPRNANQEECHAEVAQLLL